MPIYDYDGAASREIGKMYDYDGATNHEIGKAYDWDGTTNREIYSGDLTLWDRGDKTGGHWVTSAWPGRISAWGIEFVNVGDWNLAGATMRCQANSEWWKTGFVFTDFPVDVSAYNRMQVRALGGQGGAANADSGFFPFMWPSAVSPTSVLYVDWYTRGPGLGGGGAVTVDWDISAITGNWYVGWLFYLRYNWGTPSVQEVDLFKLYNA